MANQLWKLVGRLSVTDPASQTVKRREAISPSPLNTVFCHYVVLCMHACCVWHTAHEACGKTCCRHCRSAKGKSKIRELWWRRCLHHRPAKVLHTTQLSAFCQAHSADDCKPNLLLASVFDLALLIICLCQQNRQPCPQQVSFCQRSLCLLYAVPLTGLFSQTACQPR